MARKGLWVIRHLTDEYKRVNKNNVKMIGRININKDITQLFTRTIRTT